MLYAINSGDTGWMLVSALLVLMMVPAFAFFYASLFARENLLATLRFCFSAICLVTLQWVLVGYSLSFGPDHNGWIGTLAYAGLRGVGAEPNVMYAGTVPHQAFMIYHAMIASLTPVIFLIAFADRIKFSSLCLFTLLWTTCVYDPIAHWVWGVGGFLRTAGVLDFAGGAVVHGSAAMAALATALVLDKDSEDHVQRTAPNLATMTVSAGILWLGWFGLNAGSALSSGGRSAGAFVTTQIAAVTAVLTWSILDGLLARKTTFIGMLIGLLIGLVTVSPAAGYVSLWGAIGLAMTAAILSYLAFAFLESKIGHSDCLYALGVHGTAGLWGIIATGLWATKSVNPLGVDGFFSGNPAQFLIQLKAMLATAIYSFGMSYLLLKIVDYVVGLSPLEKIHSR